MKSVVLALLLLCFTGPLTAHEGRPVYIELTEQTGDQFILRWKIPPVMAEPAIPFIRLSNNNCKLTAGQRRATLAGAHIYECPAAANPSQINIHYPDKNPVLSTLILVRRLDGFEQSFMTGPDVTNITLPVREPFWQVAKRYSWAGADHILEGYDHLLFVLCLMLLAKSMRRILITVTGFTLGHSITLGMSALANWSLPPTFVEPLIAFSILILAAEVAHNRGQTLTARFPAVIATGFGLLHGFGFGGALSEIGLPYDLQIQALAFFNIGVELGQVLFVIVAYALYKLASALIIAFPPGFRPVQLRPLAVYPVGFLAAYWTIERITGIW